MRLILNTFRSDRLAVLVFSLAGAMCLISCGREDSSTTTPQRPSSTADGGKPARPSSQILRPAGSSTSSPDVPVMVSAIDLSVPDAVVNITPEETKAQTDTTVLSQVLLTADEPMSRRVAARSLGRTRSYDHLPVLLDALYDEDLTVRVYAISAINDITGMRFPYKPDAPEATRNEQAEKLVARLRQLGRID